MREITVTEPLLKLHCTLGEGKTAQRIKLTAGCVWDVSTQRLYFVDIDQNKVYTYEPSSDTIGYQTYDQKVTALALIADRPGLVAAIDEGFAYIPPSSIPFPPDATNKPLIKFDIPDKLTAKEKRFNEGVCDPAGRLLAGTLGYEHGSKDGRMFAIDGTGSSTLVLDGITCTNGMGWSQDTRTMYFTDSWIKEIAAFDYDIDTGRMSNRRVFSDIDGYGEPDGMCQDIDGGIWTCRWAAGKILRLDSSGKIDLVIDFPTAWLITCCIFGGPSLEDLYVTTASSDYIGDDLPERHDGGSVFIVKGLGFQGLDRNRYKGALP